MKKPSVHSEATVRNIGYEAGEVVRKRSAGRLVISTFRQIQWANLDE
ncbi:hypothetical protein [Dyadobacter sp. BHUBP1]